MAEAHPRPSAATLIGEPIVGEEMPRRNVPVCRDDPTDQFASVIRGIVDDPGQQGVFSTEPDDAATEDHIQDLGRDNDGCPNQAVVAQPVGHPKDEYTSAGGAHHSLQLSNGEAATGRIELCRARDKFPATRSSTRPWRSQASAAPPCGPR